MSRKRILLALDYYDYRIHKGVAKVAAKENWSLVSTHSIPRSAPIPKHWQGDGIISLINYSYTYKAISEQNLPTIDLALTPFPYNIPRVVTDNHKIGRLAAEHFLEKGVKSFVLLDTVSGGLMFQHRLEGFINQLKAHKVSILDGRYLGLKKAIQKSDGVCGIFGYHDGVAIEAMEEIRSLGFKIPKDIAIVGVDNNDLICEGTDISLSSIESDQEGLGIQAAEHLKKLLLGEKITPISELSNGVKIYYYHQPKGLITRASTDIYVTRHEKVNRALQFIQSNLENGVSASQTAEYLGMTQQGLQALFRNYYYCSPAIAIRQLRLNQAKLELRTTNENLKSISLKCGYASLDSMCRSFRRDLGVTPTQWRKSDQQSIQAK